MILMNKKLFQYLRMMTQKEFFELSMPEQIEVIKESATPLVSIGNNADVFRLFHFNVIVVENKEGEVIQINSAQALGLQ
jgi:hypothetical protein